MSEVIISSIKELNKPAAKPDSNVSYSNAVVSKSLSVTHNSTSTPDRKLNVIVYGVEECQPNTIKPVRLQKDFDSILKFSAALLLLILVQ